MEWSVASLFETVPSGALLGWETQGPDPRGGVTLAWTEPPPLDEYDPVWRLVHPESADGTFDVPTWQDLLVFQLEHETNLSFQMVMPVVKVPSELLLPGQIQPPHGWRLRGSGSWSASAAALGLKAWLWEHADRMDLDVRSNENTNRPEAVEISPGVRADDTAFEQLFATGDLGAQASQYLCELADALGEQLS